MGTAGYQWNVSGVGEVVDVWVDGGIARHECALSEQVDFRCSLDVLLPNGARCSNTEGFPKRRRVGYRTPQGCASGTTRAT